MTDPWRSCLAAADAALGLIRSDEVAAAWGRPSVLEEYAVGALAAHLGRAVFTLDVYLAAPEPDATEAVVDAPTYYATVLGDADPVDSDLHRGVRQRSASAADRGHAALVDDLEATLRAQRALELDPDRRVAVLDGIVLRARDYCLTRLVELLVHCDDLAASVDLPAPAAPEGAWDLLAPLVQQITLDRHGARHTVLALARPERHGPLGAFG